MITTPEPIEKSDPDLHDALMEYYELGLHKNKNHVDDRPILVPVTIGTKVKRNDPCPCKSGKKYKKCCGKN